MLDTFVINSCILRDIVSNIYDRLADKQNYKKVRGGISRILKISGLFYLKVCRTPADIFRDDSLLHKPCTIWKRSLNFLQAYELWGIQKKNTLCVQSVYDYCFFTPHNRMRTQQHTKHLMSMYICKVSNTKWPEYNQKCFFSVCMSTYIHLERFKKIFFKAFFILFHKLWNVVFLVYYVFLLYVAFTHSFANANFSDRNIISKTIWLY